MNAFDGITGETVGLREIRAPKVSLPFVGLVPAYGYEPSVPTEHGQLLTENGGYILMENGYRIKLERYT